MTDLAPATMHRDKHNIGLDWRACETVRPSIDVVAVELI